jgi:hypothetical protein
MLVLERELLVRELLMYGAKVSSTNTQHIFKRICTAQKTL